ncbi:MAG: endolytic transglycosylase MltG [Bacteroidia bacterium]|nr:endolytic transglycosylase MltG [Bacteroidia bacterium]
MKKTLTRPLIILGIVLAIILFALPYYRKVFTPTVKTDDGKAQEFFVYKGWDYIKVGEQLLAQQLITDPEGFHWVAEQMNYPNNVHSGRYIIENDMSNRELVTLLRSGQQTPINFTFVKFRTKEQLATYVDEKLMMSDKDLLAVMNDREFLDKRSGLTPETSLAIFIPNTYEMYWDIEPEEFYDRMFKEYKRFWSDERNAKREKIGLNRLEVMTMASIIEEETNQNDEKARMAGVYLNRVRDKWPLQADPTVKYAVGDFSIKRVLNKHLQVDSPYNTYLYPGLPPAPICTPSIPSIDAVLNSERHTYMFFCAKIDGSGYHHFSTTQAEHTAYANEYRTMLNQQGIK